MSSVQAPDDTVVSQNGHANGDSNSTMDVKEFFGRLQPYIEKLIDFYSVVSPYIWDGIGQTRQLYKQYIEPYAKQYQFQEVSTVVLGIVLLFFGGQFAMTIACYTALQISGWPTVMASYRKIRGNYEAGAEAFANDKDARGVFDVDGDGKITSTEVRNVAKRWLEGSKEEKMQILSNFRNVLIAIDPKEVMNGLTGLWSVFVTLLATLRSSFAKDIALGVSLGENILQSLSRYIKPFILSNTQISDEMKPWFDFCIESVCKFIGISIALMLVRVVSAFHSAVKGGSILARYLLKFLGNKGLAPTVASGDLGSTLESSQFFMVVQYLLAAYGFYYQLSSGFVLNSILLRLCLFPFVILETILTLLAAY